MVHHSTTTHTCKYIWYMPFRAVFESIGHVAFQYHLHRMSLVLPSITSVCGQLRL
jgi:hypothetical protein